MSTLKLLDDYTIIYKIGSTCLDTNGKLLTARRMRPCRKAIT
ncbi:MAG: hypothetical protein R3E89_15960 [Thiolinea sp.]